MGCIYSNFDGECTVWDEGVEQNGNNDKGICICEDDPDPSYLCEEYQSND